MKINLLAAVTVGLLALTPQGGKLQMSLRLCSVTSMVKILMTRACDIASA